MDLSEGVVFAETFLNSSKSYFFLKTTNYKQGWR